MHIHNSSTLEVPLQECQSSALWQFEDEMSAEVVKVKCPNNPTQDLAYGSGADPGIRSLARSCHAASSKQRPGLCFQ